MKKAVLGIVSVALVFFMATCICLGGLFVIQPVSAFESGMKILLDAGHGGVDGGVVGKTSRVKESDLNLAIVYKLKTELEEIGFEVVLTRKTEAGLYDAATKGFKKRDMQKRKEIIERENPTMVLSIHQNFYPSQTPRGGQVFYEKGNWAGERLAIPIQKELNALYEKEGVKSRNATYGEYFMLSCTKNPSVIVECGFLSNAKDEGLLLNETWQKKLVEGIAGGVLAYFSNISA